MIFNCIFQFYLINQFFRLRCQRFNSHCFAALVTFLCPVCRIELAKKTQKDSRFSITHTCFLAALTGTVSTVLYSLNCRLLTFPPLSHHFSRNKKLYSNNLSSPYTFLGRMVCQRIIPLSCQQVTLSSPKTIRINIHLQFQILNNNLPLPHFNSGQNKIYAPANPFIIAGINLWFLKSMVQESQPLDNEKINLHQTRSIYFLPKQINDWSHSFSFDTILPS